jgi:hypothetical protein
MKAHFTSSGFAATKTMRSRVARGTRRGQLLRIVRAGSVAALGDMTAFGTTRLSLVVPRERVALSFAHARNAAALPATQARARGEIALCLWQQQAAQIERDIN